MSEVFDAIIIGAGPGGSTAAISLARAGKRVIVLEKDAHPRFHIGESILPRTEPLLRELGLSERVRTLPHVPKFGAEFGWGDDPKTLRFGFTDGLLPGFPIFNIERSYLDKMLCEAAIESGAIVRQNFGVKSIVRLAENDCEVEAEDGSRLKARVILDASGHGTVVARHLGQRRPMSDPNLQKVAYFGHFENVERSPDRQFNGHPTIIMCDEGWFWLIGVNPTRTSVGFVTRPSFTKQINVPADRMLAWAVARCPEVARRMRNATGDARNRVLADFSYDCSPHAGPGFFLVGDAGCFLDPIFSTGVTLAMMGGREAAAQTIAMLDGKVAPAVAQKRYRDFVGGSTPIFWRLIKSFYTQPFRELFMNGSGPQQVHKAVISVLAGQVFPRPVFALRWRLRLFHFYVWLQKFVPLCPRRPGFSLLGATPDATTDFEPAAAAT